MNGGSSTGGGYPIGGCIFHVAGGGLEGRTLAVGGNVGGGAEVAPHVESAAPYERVDHPKHYNQHPAGIECIDVIEEMTFNLGNAVKYIWRAGLKPDTASDEDLAKAEWYLKRERERLQKRSTKGDKQ